MDGDDEQSVKVKEKKKPKNVDDEDARAQHRPTVKDQRLVNIIQVQKRMKIV